MARFLLVAAATVLSTSVALIAPAYGSAAPACGQGGYSYAGLLSTQSGSGVAAAITPIGLPTVRGGHVAAWVGVGGEGLGPGGTDEWLQAGLSAKPGTGIALYYELALPGRRPHYVMLKGHVRPGRQYRIAVVESQTQPGSWRVIVNGTPATAFIALPGSHGAWRPVVTAESWDGGTGACNAFSFGFSGIAATAGGVWSPMAARVLRTPGLRVARRTAARFVASAR
jgi:hypothetical protein